MNGAKNGDTCDATIEALSTDGRGIARIDGRAFFVSGGLPGDQVRLRLNAKARPPAATILKLLVPSPHRVSHSCPHAAKCVGSPWGSLIYEEQLRHKRELVQRTLQKTLGLVEVEPVEASPRQWHYRNRVSLRVWHGQRRVEIGFAAEARRGEGIPIGTCHLATESVAAGVGAVDSALRHMGKEHLPLLPRRIQIHHTAQGAGALLICSGACDPRIAEKWTEILGPHVLPGGLWMAGGTRAGVITPEKPIHAQANALPMRTLALGHEVDVHPAAFCQANSGAAAFIEEELRRLAQDRNLCRVWDLYGGFGSQGLAAAGSALPVEVFEISRFSESTLKELAAVENNPEVRFHGGDLLETLPSYVPSIQADDMIILDPPRSGAHADALHMVGESAAKTLIYLSCNPARLARDLAVLKPHHFHPQIIRPYDFFPQTPSIEVLTLLKR
ncbi:hypothetical protein KKH27_08700 [bacterium]|nr:hypothetical protein [bacterium]MBU1983884.1 hypothetical protein [bacterium]